MNLVIQKLYEFTVSKCFTLFCKAKLYDGELKKTIKCLVKKMTQYVLLGNFTQKRMETIKDLHASIKESAKVFESFGVKITKMVFTLGRYDVVGILEAPDEEAIAKAVLSWGSRGLLRTETLTAFSPELMVELTKFI
jgi:uncharacterized protein with GYD domain